VSLLSLDRIVDNHCQLWDRFVRTKGSMPTQNVNLTPELEGFGKSEVATGHFNNASEVHRAALSALKQRTLEKELRMERLKIDVQKGLNNFEDGRMLMG
jgi:putative addiction module CopG family antidote